MTKVTQEEFGEDGMGKEHVEIEVENIRTSIIGRVNKYMANEGDSLEVEEQGDNLERYQLARDCTRRTRKTPKRYGYADLVSYALLMIETWMIRNLKAIW